jgi:hypothetical protein
MTNYKEIIIDAITGDKIEQDYTEAQIAEVETQKQIIAEKIAVAQQIEAARAAAQAKLAALGLTTDDLKALGL